MNDAALHANRARLIAINQSPEHRARAAARMADINRRPAHRRKSAETIAAYNALPETRQIRSDTMKAKYADPAFKAERTRRQAEGSTRPAKPGQPPPKGRWTGRRISDQYPPALAEIHHILAQNRRWKSRDIHTLLRSMLDRFPSAKDGHVPAQLRAELDRLLAPHPNTREGLARIVPEAYRAEYRRLQATLGAPKARAEIARLVDLDRRAACRST